jgi:hypothetical protein
METRLFLLCATTIAIALVSLSLVLVSRGRKNRKPSAGAGRLPSSPPVLLFLAKFLALRRSIFDLAPLLRDLHARYGPVIFDLAPLLRDLPARSSSSPTAASRTASSSRAAPPSRTARHPLTQAASSPPAAAMSAPRPTAHTGALCAATSPCALCFLCLTRGKGVLRSRVD